MLDFIQKTFFKIKRSGDGPSEEERLIAMMIPFAETTERNLSRRIDQAKSESPLSYAALSIQAECRMKDRDASGISDAEEEHLRRLESLTWGSTAADKDTLYEVLCYLGYSLNRKKRTPMDKKYYEYYAKFLHRGEVKYRSLEQVRTQLWVTIKSELDLRKLFEEGFDYFGKRRCITCGTETYHVHSPDRIDHSDYEEINHIENDEPLCTGHSVVVRDDRIGLCPAHKESTTFLESRQ
jgi:hypothetical protein